MKLIDAAKRVLKTRENQVWVDYSEVWFSLTGKQEKFPVPSHAGPLLAYWLVPEICSNTFVKVGSAALFLRGTLVGIVKRTSNSSKQEYVWFSEKRAMRVAIELSKLLTTVEITAKVVSTDSEIDEFVNLSYRAFPASKTALIGDQIGRLVSCDSRPYPAQHGVTVELPNGQQECLSLDQVKFRLMIEE